MLFSRLADYSSPIKTLHLGDFPGDPVVKNLPCEQGMQVQSPMEELRSHKLQSNSAHISQLEKPV